MADKTMTKEERQQSLTNARRAWWKLGEYIISAMEADDPMRIDIQCLLDEFKRMDEKEQKQIRAGKKGGKFGVLGAEHGKKGGRPRKTEGK